MSTFEVSLAWCNANNRWHPEVLSPGAYGVTEVKINEPGDYSRWAMNVASTNCVYSGGEGVKIQGGTLQGVNGLRFEDFDLLGAFTARESWTSQPQLSKNLTFKKIRCGQHLYSPFRFRYGTTNITLDECSGHRVGLLQTAADVPFIYFSDYGNSLATIPGFLPCNFKIVNCEMSGYSDFIQLGAPRNGIDWGCYGGSLIKDCRAWVRPEHYVDGGKRMAPGLEQLMLDAKDDGTADNPLIVDGFTCYGSRPAILAGGGTPGYVTTIHKRGHIQFRNIRLIDCVGGFMQKQSDCAATYESLDVFNMSGHDPSYNPWLSKNDTLFCGQGPARVTKLRHRGLSRMAEFDNPASAFIDCGAI